MRAVRPSLCLLALATILILSGCGQSSTSQKALPHASPPAVRPNVNPTATSTPQVTANPVRLLIPAIGVNAHVEAVGVQANGDLAIPTQNPWEDVGWYKSGPRPGERGSAVIDGHLNRPGNYPAVFWHLEDLHVGDQVMVTGEQGKTLHFHVIGMAFYSPDKAPIQLIFGNESGIYLNLVTCAGDWIPSQHQTTLRLVIFTSFE